METEENLLRRSTEWVDTRMDGKRIVGHFPFRVAELLVVIYGWSFWKASHCGYLISKDLQE